MKKFLANLLVSGLGRVLFPILAALLAYGLAWLAAKLPFMAPVLALVNPYELATIIMAAIMTLILGRVHRVLGESVEPIQEWLRVRGYDLRVDGWMGDLTANALAREKGTPVREAVEVPKLR